MKKTPKSYINLTVKLARKSVFITEWPLASQVASDGLILSGKSMTAGPKEKR